MTTDVQTPASEVATIEANLATAKTELESAQNAFAAMMADPTSVGDATAQMAVFESLKSSQAKATNLEASLESAQKRARLAVLEGPASTLRELVNKALAEVNIGAMLKDAQAGNVVALTCVYNTPEGGEPNWSVSHRFPGQVSTGATKPASESSAEPTSRARVTIVTPDGEFTTKEYIFRYWEAAKSAGYRTTRATADVVPANEYAKIAPVIAAKLGHTVK